jgi:hypothetical protein
VELCGAAELHAAFREESRTSLPSISAALREIQEDLGLFVVFIRPQSLQDGSRLAEESDFIGNTSLAAKISGLGLYAQVASNV